MAYNILKLYNKFGTVKKDLLKKQDFTWFHLSFFELV